MTLEQLQSGLGAVQVDVVEEPIEAHHLHWWSHGGRTDLDNGILLCTAHHHIIDRGWNVQVVDNVPWFIPPARIDPTRTPRRGGRLPTPQLH